VKGFYAAENTILKHLLNIVCALLVSLHSVLQGTRELSKAVTWELFTELFRLLSNILCNHSSN